MITPTLPDDMAAKVARLLLKIEAVHYYSEQPFKFTSGTLSPVYVDCRWPISFVDEREAIVEAAVELLRPLNFECIAGGETAGIPYAALIAAQLRKPMVYVRKRRKGFGRDAQIEGLLPRDARTLLIEDLMFDGKSKLNFCLALREAGAVVDYSFSVFDYGIAASQENLAPHGIKSLALTNWRTLLTVGVEDGVFTPGQAEVVHAFLDDPAGWHAG